MSTRTLIQWFTNFLTRKLQIEILKMKIFETKNYQKNCKNQLLENWKNAKYTHIL